VTTNRPWRRRLAVAFVFASAVTGWLVFAGAAGALPPLPQTGVTGLPADVLIGDSFTFLVHFRNVPGRDTGYGPFIDLAFDYHGADGFAGGHCDGVFFQNAVLVGVTGSLPPLVRTNMPAGTYPTGTDCTVPPFGTTLSHPYGLPPVTVPLGWHITTVELPFGSFEASQPDIVLKVTAKLDEFADEGTPPLDNICFRGGFRYGSTPTGVGSTPPAPQFEKSPNVLGDWHCEKVTPQVLTLKKTYIGPESETAAGPNFMKTFKVTANIANMQKIQHLTLKDVMAPAAALATSNLVVMAGGTTLPVVTGGCLPGKANLTTTGTGFDVELCDPVTGGTGVEDVKLTYSFYVKPGVVPQSCVPRQITNTVQAYGDWTPLDTRDVPPPPGSLLDSASTVFSAKCLAIQKSVNMTSTRPGDTLTYTLSFQVSDYFTIGYMVVTDFLADGQRFVPNSATLIMKDRFGSSIRMNPIAPYFNKVIVGPPASCLAGDPPKLVKGGTVLTFHVSTAAIQRHQPPRGLLTGGLAFPPNMGPAMGTITFKAKVGWPVSATNPPGSNSYFYAKPGNENLDEHDPINNCVGIRGTKFVNTPTFPPPATPFNNVHDGSMTGIRIRAGVFTKKIFAIRRNGTLFLAPSSLLLAADDQITFELRYALPTTDIEHFTIRDWAPQPALKIPSFFATAVPACIGSGAPAVNHACRAFTGQVNALVPSVTAAVAGGNSLKFNFAPATFGNNANTPSTIRLRFTLKMSNDLYADLLHLTNEAQQCEENSFGDPSCQVAIAEFIASEPLLQIRKGVIETTNPDSNPNAVYVQTPTAPPNVTFSGGPLTASPSFFGSGLPMTEATLDVAGQPRYLNSDVVGGLQANDVVTFAIVVGNYGSSHWGAFDTKITDSLPPQLTLVPGSLAVRWGNGTSIPFNGNLFGAGLVLTDVSATQGRLFADTAAPGPSTNFRSIAIITYRAKLASTFAPGCVANSASIAHYAAAPYTGLPGFRIDLAGIDLGPTGGLAGTIAPGTTPGDGATACAGPILTKSIRRTSETSTDPSNSLSPFPLLIAPLTIGEIVRYRLKIEVPALVYPQFKITDLLPPSLAYLNDGTTKIAYVEDAPGGNVFSPAPIGTAPFKPGNESTEPGITPTFVLPPANILGGSFNCASPGADPTFDLGNLTNNESDSNKEFVIIEFNALVCNTPLNQNSGSLMNNGTLLTNSFTTQVSSGSPIPSLNSVQAQVVEPQFTMAKTVTNSTATGGLLYTVTATNTGTATAFDAVLKDTLPTGLQVSSGSVAFTGVPGCNSSGSNATMVKVSCPSVAILGTLKVTFNAKCVVKGTYTNQVTLDWSSLPGLQGTLGNQTGSSPSSGSSGTNSGERLYSQTAAAPSATCG
jgi:uncharacterized repeat protein (TIGR01451 family)